MRKSKPIAGGGVLGSVRRLRRGADKLSDEGLKSEHLGGAEAKAVVKSEQSAPLVEVAGRVKWFDATKGYGFIVPDGGEADVLIHVTVLRRDGFQSIHEGARVVAEAMHRDRGLQVVRVISVEVGEGVHPSQLAPARTHSQAASVGNFEIVIVKWFNRLRGFGFLSRGEGTEDIFVHMETLRRYGFVDVKPGDSLLARFGPGSKGLMAAEVRPLEGSRLLASH